MIYRNIDPKEACIFCGFLLSDHPVVIRGHVTGRVYTCDPDETPDSRALVLKKRSELVPVVREVVS